MHPTPGERPNPDNSRRRDFLRASVLLAPVAAMSVAGLHPQAASAAGSPGQYTPPGQLFDSMRDHQRDHVAFLEAVLGNDTRPFPHFRELEQDNLKEFVLLARTLANVGARAYLGALPYVLDQSLLSDLASIGMVEARHAAVLNTFVGYNITWGDQSFEFPWDDDDVREAIQPHIIDLNGGPPIAYSKTRSDANDTNILNFALVLEYLERRFYNINVPKFGGGGEIQPF